MKKLFRIKNQESMIGGVCQGLSEYLDIDVSILRIIFAVSIFTPIPIIIVYVLMWIIIPKKTIETAYVISE